jgi:flagellin
MSVVVNSNPAASKASLNLSRASDALRKSLARLSSGSRIVDSYDDPGGMSVAYKLRSRQSRTEALRTNVQNGLSFLQLQDGVLSSAGEIASRMSELRTMAQDVTKNPSDIENYSKEFLELQKQLSQMYREKFNGVSLFSVSGASAVSPPNGPVFNKSTDYNSSGESVTHFSRTIYTHDSGQFDDGNVSIGAINFQDVFNLGALDTRHVQTFDGKFSNLSNPSGLNVTNYITLEDENSEVFTSDGFLVSILFVSMGQFTSVIERIADARAENGAEQNRLLKVDNLLASNMTNLEAAHGRIMDADIALESTRFAKENVLVQASASMVAQANQLTQIALTLIGG